jgi:hypothetical protein
MPVLESAARITAVYVLGLLAALAGALTMMRLAYRQFDRATGRPDRRAEISDQTPAEHQLPAWDGSIDDRVKVNAAPVSVEVEAC